MIKQKHIAAILISLLFTLQTTGAQESLDVDQIISKHINSIGGLENIKAIDNLVYSGGTYQEGDFTSSGNSSMSLARPYFKLVGNKNNMDGYMEGYDGSAWEYYSGPGVVVRTVGPPSEAIRHYAGVEHPLVNYKKKGSTAELLEPVEFEGSMAIVIKLTRMDGFVEHFYLDRKTFMIRASGADAPIHAFGDDVSQVTKISDYRDVAGVLIGHRFQSMELPSGDAMSSMQWGKIEANITLPDDWFSPPKLSITPLQNFGGNLYEQRQDITSVMWTYKHFRLAYPTIDTSEMVNFAGFQMLKMGSIESATVLLEQNVMDYPDSSNVHYELGRAYVSGDRLQDARTQFEHALRIDPQNRNAQRSLDSL